VVAARVDLRPVAGVRGVEHRGQGAVQTVDQVEVAFPGRGDARVRFLLDPGSFVFSFISNIRVFTPGGERRGEHSYKDTNFTRRCKHTLLKTGLRPAAQVQGFRR
jgi:hypothetical protein